jgi:hypothetical protein
MSLTAVIGALASAFLSGFLLPAVKSWLSDRSTAAAQRKAGAQDVITAAANDAATKERGYADVLARDRGRGAVADRLRNGSGI